MTRDLAEDAGEVDILVNNAGVYQFGSTAEVDDKTFSLHLDTNLRAPFLLVKHLWADEFGPGGVRVNAVGPGPIETAMLDRVTGGDAAAKAAFLGTVPSGRAGTPAEVAEVIRFISSPGAAYLTGQTIFLDGGMTAA